MEAAGRTVAGTAARHRLRNPRLGRISVIILRAFWTILAYNYKVSGLILITQLLGG